MSDLIDREALLRQIDIDSEGEPGFYGDTWQFIDTIKRMPSAQPEPTEECERCMMEHTDEMEKLEAELAMAQPKRGKWICTGEPDESWGMMYECSICGNHDYGGNYCSYCGAKMEDSEDE